MKKYLKSAKALALGVVVLFLLCALSVRAQSEPAAAPAAGRAELDLFYSNACPYCQQARIFLAGLRQKYPGLDLREYEISDAQNKGLLAVLAALYGRETTGVPVIFIGDQATEGFDDSIGATVEAKVGDCLRLGCVDPLKKLQNSLRLAAASQQSVAPSAGIQKPIATKAGKWGEMTLFFGLTVSAPIILAILSSIILIISACLIAWRIRVKKIRRPAENGEED